MWSVIEIDKGDHVKLSRTVLTTLSVAVAACVAAGVIAVSWSASAATTVTARYSPLGATANGPSGPATAKFTATPYCCPSTAVVLTPQSAIGENDFQWMVLGLPWDHASVTAVRVCYAISSASGGSYISQTRISNMIMPNSATVLVDNPTNRTSTAPACYTVKTGFTPTGALTLELKVVFASSSDRITIGMVSLTGPSA
jgi:hypothetical protein